MRYLLLNFVLDVDECSSNSNSCDVNAVGSNAQGSYTCAVELDILEMAELATGVMLCFSFLLNNPLN